MAQIQAMYDKTIFETAKDGILVALYNVIGDKCRTVKGNMLPAEKGVIYNMDGEWITHNKYGEQFRCDAYTEDTSSEDNIIKFLSSSIIKGIGPATAKRIVDKFGKDTIHVMDTNIDALKGIKGLSAKKFEEMKASYEKQRMVKDVALILGKYGISTNQATKCYKEFKEDTLNIIKTTPYMLSYIEGISFPTVDRIGWDIPGYEFNEDRFYTCANYVLYNNEMGAFNSIIGDRAVGSNMMEVNDFGLVMYNLLRIKDMQKQYVSERTCDLIKSRKIKLIRKNNKQYVMPMSLFNMEYAMADMFYSTQKYEKEYDCKVVENAIKNAAIKLSDEQKEAVRKAYENGLSMIVGVPGAGKTTTVNTIAKAYKKMHKDSKMYFLAPSGRAASRIKETLDLEIVDNSIISTIHSALELKADVKDAYAEEIKIENALVVVDEWSMVDTRIAYRLFASMKDCTVVLCGDEEQLPSIGSGAVLRDMLRCKEIPSTVLSKVYRQAEESDIYQNIIKMRNNETDLVRGKDFHFIEESNTQLIEDKMVDLYLQKIEEYGIENVMLISPMHEKNMGVKNLNNRIQEAIHPAASCSISMKYAYEFREGDVVMQTVNDYETGVMNGDIGIITGIFHEGNDKKMRVKYPHVVKEYTKENIEELTLGYAYTVHKAQGSEAKCVILCVHKAHGRMLKKNVYYTGITRGKKEVYVIGQEEALVTALTTMDTNERLTTLENEISRAYGNFYQV